MIILFTYFVAALILGLYIWWFVVRYRRDQRKKQMAEGAVTRPLSSVPRPVRPQTTPLSRPEPTVPGMAPATSPATPGPAASSAAAVTVADALAGIKLPHDLLPLTTMAPRVGSGDRVAFWTKAPGEVVGPAFADELERLGYTVSALDQRSLAAARGEDRLVVYIHPDGAAAEIDGRKAFESVPEGAVVIEVLIPF